MATTSQTSTTAALAKVSRKVRRGLGIAALAIAATLAGVTAATLALSLASGSGDSPTLTAPALIPGSRDDYYRDQRPAVGGHVRDQYYLEGRETGAAWPARSTKDAWYLEQRVPAIEIRDRWYRE